MMNPSYKLTLADGFDLRITAGDADASPIVDMLAGAMLLSPGKAKHSLLVLTGQETEPFSMNAETIICRFPPPENRDDLVTKAMRVSLAIAHAAQKRGGFLVHGGLAEFQGQGVILAAPGGTGKTTASTRLPAPWRSLSDDAVLIVRNAQGNYSGHPWPTWSRFYLNGPGGAWNTAYGAPLKVLYFLFQSPNDALEVLKANQAAAMLIESVEQANSVFGRMLPPADIHENHRRQFSLVCELADRLPAYRLGLCKTGRFWTLIEDSLNRPGHDVAMSTLDRNDEALIGVAGQLAPPGVVLSGNSMYPTLKEPGYLEVLPYGRAKPRRGDVVYFRAPGSGAMVVHRVMAIQPEGLITSGDNNPHNDPDVVPLSAVEGRVCAVRGAGFNRKVQGGTSGMLFYTYARIIRRTRAFIGRIYHLFFSPNSLTGSLRFFAPQSLHFKFVCFGKIPRGELKILSDNVCVGHYSRGVWHIAYPWRLWVEPVKIKAAAELVDSEKGLWRGAHIETLGVNT